MVSASDRQAMIFACPAAGPRSARKLRPAGKLGQAGRERATGDEPRLRERQDPWPRGDSGYDAGRTAEGEQERQMGLRPRTLQASERGRAAVPKTQGLPARLHAVRQARLNGSGLPEFLCRRRNDIRFSINKP